MRARDSTHIILPTLFLSQEEFDTRVIWLICARELNSFRLHVPSSSDFNIEAVSVELRSTVWSWKRRRITMKRKQFGAEDVHARLDVARDPDNVSAIIVEDLFIGPFLLRFVKAIALDLKEGDILGLRVWSWQLAQVLMRGELVSGRQMGLALPKSLVRCAFELFRSNVSRCQSRHGRQPSTPEASDRCHLYIEVSFEVRVISECGDVQAMPGSSTFTIACHGSGFPLVPTLLVYVHSMRFAPS